MTDEKIIDFLNRKITKKEWRYICENGHKWKSHSSPGGGVFAPLTTCPKCGTEICQASEYLNGKFQGGAIHRAFGLKGKKKEKELKSIAKESFMASLMYGK